MAPRIRFLAMFFVLSWVCNNAVATLQGRDLDASRPGFEAYYDTAQNITWLADASYARSSGYSPTGRMRYEEAFAWASGLTVYGLGGWRLPQMKTLAPDTCVYAYSGGDCGYNVNTSRSELAYMFSQNLGLKGQLDGNGQPLAGPPGLLALAPRNFEGVRIAASDSGGVFNNLGLAYWSTSIKLTLPGDCPSGVICELPADPVVLAPTPGYWTFSEGGTQFIRCLIASQCIVPPPETVNAPSYPWIFSLEFGIQSPRRYEPDTYPFAWAVRDGDVVPVPETSTWTLMLAGAAVMLAFIGSRGSLQMPGLFPGQYAT